MRKHLWFLMIPWMLVSFQNCAPSGAEFEDLEIASEKAFFNYPHTSTPEFFGDVLLFQEPEDTGSLSEFRFVGMASYVADDLASITYTVRILGDSDQLLCATQNGVLAAGESSIEFSCVTGVDSSQVKIIMKLDAAGKSTTIEKIYHK